MTEVSSYRDSMFSLERVRSAMRFLSDLSLASSACQANFMWLYLRRHICIPLLDFDIICGALPTLVLRKKMEEAAEERREPLFGDFIGPHTIRFLLGVMHEFGLPPGTLGEILNRKRRLTGSLTTRASNILRMLKKAANSEDPTSVIVPLARSSSNLPEVLLEELTSFVGDLGDVELLDSLMSRAIPASELIADRDEGRNAMAYRWVYGTLSGQRPLMTLNNFHDALNVAFVVRAFNCPACTGTARRVPVLISQTRTIARLETAREWLTLSTSEDKPLLFNNGIYLTIAMGLRENYEGRFQVAADEAQNLRDDAHRLLVAYSSLLSECRVLVERGVSETEIDSSMLPHGQWELLLVQTSQFHEEWASLLTQPCRAIEQDRIQYLNRLLSPKANRLLHARRPSEIRQGVQKLLRHLRTRAAPTHDIWGPILHYEDMGPCAEEVSLGRRPTFAFSVIDPDETLLSEMAPGTDAVSFDFAGIPWCHHIKLAAHPSYISKGALLCVESWRNPSRTHASFCAVAWSHNVDVETIWNTGSALLREAVAGELGETQLSYSLFTPDSRIDGRGDFKSALKVLEGDGDSLLALEYVELETNGVTFFADVVPLDGAEFQAGVVMPTGAVSDSLRRKLAECISGTSTVVLDKSNYEYLVDRAFTMLGVVRNTT